MDARAEQLFSLEDLTPEWLPTPRATTTARWMWRLAIWLSLAGIGVNIFGIVLGLAFQPVENFSSSHVPKAVCPNSATHRLLLRALAIQGAGIVFAAVTVAFLLTNVDLPTWLWPLLVLAAGSVFAASGLLALDKGGTFVLRHYSVRFVLWIMGLAPLRYVRFLESCADLGLLKRVGGSYQFFHKDFRTYVARRYGSEWLPADQVDPTEGGVHS